MKNMTTKHAPSLSVVSLIFPGSQFFFTLNAMAEERIVNFDDNNVLERPTGYREWIYVGTPVIPNELK